MQAYEYSESWYKNLEFSLDLIRSDPDWRIDVQEKRIAVEIGVFEGMSSCLISDRLLNHPESKLISIDSFQGSKEDREGYNFAHVLPTMKTRAYENIKKSKNSSKVRIIEKKSCDAFGELIHDYGRKDWIDFLYIDAGHKFKDVEMDISLYVPLVRQGGLIIFDDYHPRWEGVTKAIDCELDKWANLEKRDHPIPQFVCRVV